VRELLRPLTEPSPKISKVPEVEDDKLANVFDTLELEEPTLALDGNSIVSPSQWDQKVPSEKVDIGNSHDDILLSSLLFFLDLSRF